VGMRRGVFESSVMRMGSWCGRAVSGGRGRGGGEAGAGYERGRINASEGEKNNDGDERTASRRRRRRRRRRNGDRAATGGDSEEERRTMAATSGDAQTHERAGDGAREDTVN